MSEILIRNVLHEGQPSDILIKGNRFSSISPAGSGMSAETVIDASGMAILPPFYNTHGHAAMTLLRGYADDMELFKWLSEYIWPYEDKLTPEDIYNGSRLAILEMIKSGTVFFSDMYFEIDETARAVDEMGVRAALGVTFMSNHSKALRDEKVAYMKSWKDRTNGRIQLTAAPHAIYTADAGQLMLAANTARELGMKIHIHVSETATEVQNSIKEFGDTPVRYLEKLGFLGPDVIAAHVVHVDDEEIEILKKRGVTISHCPCSNMKLSSGAFRADAMVKAGAKVTLGTDGCSSNNNLDMREEMKFASFLAKVTTGDPEVLPAQQVFEWATRNGAEAFGIDAGVIEVGKLADAILVRLDDPKMTPNHNLISNWVYAADTSCIDTVICDGRIIMQGRHVPGEEEILAAVKRN
ncbi:MAG: amidohydrolase [Bacteroidales bacterium]|nr:amidohydrolase [Candidatus Cryptobacteroides caccocaballi]